MKSSHFCISHELNCYIFQGCMNNITFGDSEIGYYETVAGGAGAVSITHDMFDLNCPKEVPTELAVYLVALRHK